MKTFIFLASIFFYLSVAAQSTDSLQIESKKATTDYEQLIQSVITDDSNTKLINAKNQSVTPETQSADLNDTHKPPPLVQEVAINNLWDRIRRGYAIPNLEEPLVKNREDWYAARPDYIERMTERSKKYLFHIVEELEARQMPTDLALLPFIESAFNPQAVSTAKAAGMWQFIPSTGRDFLLKQNTFRDDRRDVLASTRAALDYLQKLYAMFNDWHLALAAYNWGEGSVRRAIAKNKKLGLPTGYSDLKMPSETRYYIPKLQAVKNIVTDPERFNIKLLEIENQPYFVSVPVKRDIDIELVAKLAQVSIADFKALNPSLSRPVILASGTPQVLLPFENAEVFIKNLNNHTGKLASWTAWTLPIGLKPQDAAKRLGIAEQTLRQLNGLGLKMGTIKAGSTLLIPRSATSTDDVAAHIADNGQLTLLPPPSKQGACKVVKLKNGKTSKCPPAKKVKTPSSKVKAKKSNVKK